MARKSKATSAKKVAANRRNAQKSTGPRVSRRALLRQSRYVKMLSYDQARLGESSEDFQEYLADLVADWQPIGAMEMTLVEDLATLEMERRLVDRAQRGRLVHRLEREEAVVDRNARRLNDESTDRATREAVVELGLRNSPDCPAKFHQVMDLLEGVIAMVRSGDFSNPLEAIFITLYGEHPSWRASQIINLYGRFVERYTRAPENFPGQVNPGASQSAESAGSNAGDSQGLRTNPKQSATSASAKFAFDNAIPSEREMVMDALNAPFESPDGRAPWGDPRGDSGGENSSDKNEFRSLQHLLMEEYDEVLSGYCDFTRDCSLLTRSRRDALLAPTGYRSALLIRQRNSIDRHLERKIKLLILLQKERRNREGCPNCSEFRNTRGRKVDAGTVGTSVPSCVPTRRKGMARRRVKSQRGVSRMRLSGSAAWLAMLWLAQQCSGVLAHAKRAGVMLGMVGALILFSPDAARPQTAHIAAVHGLRTAPISQPTPAQVQNCAIPRDVFLRVESHYVDEKKENRLKVGSLDSKVSSSLLGREDFDASISSFDPRPFPFLVLRFGLSTPDFGLSTSYYDTSKTITIET